MVNPWVTHVKQKAQELGLTYGCAISDKRVKDSYVKQPKPEKQTKEKKQPKEKKERKKRSSTKTPIKSIDVPDEEPLILAPPEEEVILPKKRVLKRKVIKPIEEVKEEVKDNKVNDILTILMKGVEKINESIENVKEKVESKPKRESKFSPEQFKKLGEKLKQKKESKLPKKEVRSLDEILSKPIYKELVRINTIEEFVDQYDTEETSIIDEEMKEDEARLYGKITENQYIKINNIIKDGIERELVMIDKIMKNELKTEFPDKTSREINDMLSKYYESQFENIIFKDILKKKENKK